MRSELEGIADGWAYYRVIFERPSDIPLPKRSDLEEWYKTMPGMRPRGLLRLPGVRWAYELGIRYGIRNRAYKMFKPK